MNNIEIIANGYYLPGKMIDNNQLSEKLNLPQDYIYKRTGIKQRYYADKETIEEIAIKAVENLKENKNFDIKQTQMIIVSTTSTNKLMPGISYKIQEKFDIPNCMCLDILAGCAGYINSFDIARNYIAIGKINQALIIGVDLLSKYTDKSDVSTSIILSDGAGATIIRKTDEEKVYKSKILSNGKDGEILTNKINEYIKMNGKEIYKYAVTETISNIKQLLDESNISIDEIKYIVPHQSNIKIINSIQNRLNIEKEKIYTNIENVGNTFCASIPIVLNEMFEKKLLNKGDKVILLGYGGGLNTGSILLEI